MGVPVVPPSKKRKSLLWIAVAYLAAAGVALITGTWLRGVHPLRVVAAADLAATLTIFGFSVALDNSSVYDPYWSAAPPLIAAYYVAVAPGQATAAPGALVRRIVVLFLVWVWAVRLTWHALRRWEGLHHEDWRYHERRARHGRAYWWVSLGGFHLLPTVVVYLACLSLYGVLGPARQPAVGARPLGVLDLLALLVTGAAIYTEARADGELWRFLGARKRGDLPPDAVLEMGLRSYARYPNYLGEMGFWWGLYLFALAAAPHLWWTIVGPLAVTALFVTISIPMMERRMRDRRAQRGTAV